MTPKDVGEIEKTLARIEENRFALERILDRAQKLLCVLQQTPPIYIQPPIPAPFATGFSGWRLL